MKVTVSGVNVLSLVRSIRLSHSNYIPGPQLFDLFVFLLYSPFVSVIDTPRRRKEPYFLVSLFNPLFSDFLLGLEATVSSRVYSPVRLEPVTEDFSTIRSGEQYHFFFDGSLADSTDPTTR